MSTTTVATGDDVSMLQSLLTLLERQEVWIGLTGLASFLAIYWVLRGAVPGVSSVAEADDGAPSASLRERSIALTAAGAGLIAVAGCVAFSQGILWSIPLFALGIGLDCLRQHHVPQVPACQSQPAPIR